MSVIPLLCNASEWPLLWCDKGHRLCKAWIATITQDEIAGWRVIASQVNQTISQDACIMHASWEAHKGVNEATLMVTDCLQHHGWIQLPVHEVLTIRAARTFNLDVGPVDGPS